MFAPATASAWPLWPQCLQWNLIPFRLALLMVPQTGPPSAGVLRYHVLYLDTCQPCLVLDEPLQLVEGPGMQAAALILVATLAAEPDAGQILHADGAHTES